MFEVDKLKSIINELVYSRFEVNSEDLPIWAIGDVHGCGDQYEEILKGIDKETPNRIIYQLGDLIDRGPDLLRLFELSDEYGVRLIIGNHELNFVQELYGYKPCRSKARTITHKKFKKLKGHQQDYIVRKIMTSLNRSEVYSNGRYFHLSHSLPRTEPMIIQSTNAASMCMVSDQGSDLANMRVSNVVHGHKHWEYTDISEQIKNRVENNHIFNIDSGCVYGKELTAMELSSLQYIQVQGIDFSEE